MEIWADIEGVYSVINPPDCKSGQAIPYPSQREGDFGFFEMEKNELNRLKREYSFPWGRIGWDKTRISLKESPSRLFGKGNTRCVLFDENKYGKNKTNRSSRFVN